MKARSLQSISGVALLFYVASYMALSLNGRYEPTVWGINGPKASFYQWAPLGFVSDWQRNNSLLILYLPLWWIDTRTVHDFDECWTGKYPVHEFE